MAVLVSTAYSACTNAIREKVPPTNCRLVNALLIDINACKKDNRVNNYHCGTDSCTYTGSMENYGSINGDISDQEGYHKEIAQSLKSLLLSLWDPSSILYQQPNHILRFDSIM